MEQEVRTATKNISKAGKPWIQALGSFSQAKAGRLQGSSVSSLVMVYLHAFLVKQHLFFSPQIAVDWHLIFGLFLKVQIEIFRESCFTREEC